MSTRETDGSIAVGSQHPAFQALLRQTTQCSLCTEAAYCATGGVLVKTLREASGEDV